MTAAALQVLVPARGIAGKKNRCKKVRCRDLRQTCQANSKEQSCCQGLNCDPVSGQGSLLLCCLGRQQRCLSSAECCGRTICLNVAGLPNPRCCGTGGEVCGSTLDCCQGFECSGGACAAISDRALKASFASVDPVDILHRVRALPLAVRHGAGSDPSIPHIGPEAQAFAAAFGVGAGDRHIHPIDGQGVAFVAIQGLAADLERLRLEREAIAARVSELEQRS